LESALNATCGKYSKFEVLNLGMGGYDIQYAVERFSIHGQKYNPNLVVWLINSHNLTQIREYLQPIQDSLEKNTSESVKQDHYTKSDYAFMVNQATQKMNDVYGKNNILNQQKQFFQRFSSLYQGPLAIIMFSSSQNSVKDVVREYASTRDRTYFYDGLPDIQNEYVLSDGHPSVKGYDLISQNIYKYLVSQKILPCQ
jgi:hypothetical protein